MAAGPSELRIGTRGSQLALWQANTVAARLAAAGAPSCRIVVIRTTGDQLQDRPLSEVGGKRLFVKEIEDALLRGEIDLAVHSSKDMPAILPDGLGIAGVLPREDPHDAVVLPISAEGSGRRAFGALSLQPSALVDLLGPTPSIGTGSVRRVAQLRHLFPGARFANIRGNLDTRLRKLDAGEHDAIVLAAAGLKRLGLEARIRALLEPALSLPAAGQGALGIECRDDRPEIVRLVAPLADADTAACVRAERAVSRALGGSCTVPLGAYAQVLRGRVQLQAVVAAPDGRRVARAEDEGAVNAPETLGERVAALLRARGAAEILAELQAIG